MRPSNRKPMRDIGATTGRPPSGGLAPQMIIYKVVCLETNKIYIGKTIKTLNVRKLNHLHLAKTGKGGVFHRAIRKYGEDAFIWEVLDTVMFSDLLLDLEKFYIAKYNCMVPNGYNMTTGGDGASGYKRPGKMSKDVREKISKSRTGQKNSLAAREKMSKNHRGHPLSEETKRKISLAKMGNNYNVGKHHSEETKKKMSLVQKGIKKSNYKNKKVVDLNKIVGQAEHMASLEN
jgi:group I intron endonuclease